MLALDAARTWPQRHRFATPAAKRGEKAKRDTGCDRFVYFCVDETVAKISFRFSQFDGVFVQKRGLRKPITK